MRPKTHVSQAEEHVARQAERVRRAQQRHEAGECTCRVFGQCLCRSMVASNGMPAAAAAVPAAAEAVKDAVIEREERLVSEAIGAPAAGGREVALMARQGPLPSSDSSQFPSTCSSLPLVCGCSNVVC